MLGGGRGGRYTRDKPMRAAALRARNATLHKRGYERATRSDGRDDVGNLGGS